MTVWANEDGRRPQKVENMIDMIDQRMKEVDKQIDLMNQVMEDKFDLLFKPRYGTVKPFFL